MTIRSLVFQSSLYSSKAVAARGAKRAQHEPVRENEEIYYLKNDANKWWYEVIEIDEDETSAPEFPAEDVTLDEAELVLAEDIAGDPELVDYAINEGTNSEGEPAVPATPAPVALPKARSSVPAYKQMYSRRPSQMDGPFVIVHGFLDAHGKEFTRKEAIAKLVAMGVNFSTARTQYQRWFSKQQVAAFMASLDADKKEGGA